MRWDGLFVKVVVWGLILWGGAEALLGCMQLLGIASSHHPAFPVTGTFYNPGPYGGFLAMVFPLVLWQRGVFYPQRSHSLCYRSLYLLLSGLLVVILGMVVASMSRSAWVAVLFSSAWVGWFDPVTRKRVLFRWHRRRSVFLFIVIALVVAGGSAYYLKKDSARGRLFMWKVSCLAISERPWQGHGAGRFAGVYGDTQENYFCRGDYTAREEYVAGSPEYAFNEYLHLAVERGIPVLLVVVLGLVGALYAGVRKGLTGVTGAVFSLMIFAFASYPMQFPAFGVALVLLILALVVSRHLIYIGIIPVVAVLAVLGWRSGEVKRKAALRWEQAEVYVRHGDYRRVVDRYRDIYEELRTDPRFLFDYGYAYHQLGESEASTGLLMEAMEYSSDPMILNIIGKNYQLLGDYEEAERWFRRSVCRLPGRHYPFYLLVKLYNEPEFFDEDRLREAASVVLEKEPKVMSTAVREMREEVEGILFLIDQKK